MANPSEVFRAMAYGDPYPIKAFFALGNNALMSYPNQHQIHKAMLNQDLIAYELFMTWTAMMAITCCPAMLSRNAITSPDTWNWTTRLGLSQKVAEPPEQASNSYQFWRDLAARFGFEQWFPWSTHDEVLDHRLSRSGRSFAISEAQGFMEIPPARYRKYRKTGFATPSGSGRIVLTGARGSGF